MTSRFVRGVHCAVVPGDVRDRMRRAGVWPLRCSVLHRRVACAAPGEWWNGRHWGLKSPWPEGAVRVRVPARPPACIRRRCHRVDAKVVCRPSPNRTEARHEDPHRVLLRLKLRARSRQDDGRTHQASQARDLLARAHSIGGRPIRGHSRREARLLEAERGALSRSFGDPRDHEGEEVALNRINAPEASTRPVQARPNSGTD